MTDTISHQPTRRPAKDIVALWQAYKGRGDESARERIITHYLYLSLIHI